MLKNFLNSKTTVIQTIKGYRTTPLLNTPPGHTHTHRLLSFRWEDVHPPSIHDWQGFIWGEGDQGMFPPSSKEEKNTKLILKLSELHTRGGT